MSFHFFYFYFFKTEHKIKIPSLKDGDLVDKNDRVASGFSCENDAFCLRVMCFMPQRRLEVGGCKVKTSLNLEEV